MSSGAACRRSSRGALAQRRVVPAGSLLLPLLMLGCSDDSGHGGDGGASASTSGAGAAVAAYGSAANGGAANGGAGSGGAANGGAANGSTANGSASTAGGDGGANQDGVAAGTAGEQSGGQGGFDAQGGHGGADDVVPMGGVGGERAGAPSDDGGSAGIGDQDAGAAGAEVADGGADAGSAGGSSDGSGGPNVNRSEQRLYEYQFRASDADAQASATLGAQYAYLDTRAEPVGKLVVYLHGAGTFNECGNLALGTLVASFGFHWFAPCYSSNYGVDNCGDDIAGCRLEAFEGEDHHGFVNIGRADSIEERVVRGLAYLQEQVPQGDWEYFLDGDEPRWSEIVISGHSHGASSSGIIGMHREVYRVVMLAGPYDVGQAWLGGTPLTSRDRYFGFTHTGDGQHQGHLDALEALGLPGQPIQVDSAQPPYSDSHRLFSSAGVGDPHGSVGAGDYEAFVPVWRYLYAQ